MLNELLIKARSCRSFVPNKQVAYDDIVKMINNARICSATRNSQPLKYKILHSESEVGEFMPITYWAKSLGIKLPPDGHEPTAFIILFHDEEIVPFQSIYYKDVGICAEAITLTATELGLGSCMIGSFDAEKTKEIFSLRDSLMPVLCIALGYADETAIIEDALDGEIKYYRDENNVHHVPKRPLEEIIL